MPPTPRASRKCAAAPRASPLPCPGARPPAKTLDDATEDDDDDGDSPDPAAAKVLITDNPLALAAANLNRVIADLTIPGCRGPETHDFGKSAVHWYMKA